MNSGIYVGTLRHRRFAPRPHQFEYRLFMMLLDLSELDLVFHGRWFWSTRRPAPVRFRRADYLGDQRISLDEAVRRLVAEQTGTRPCGPIRMLANLRMFGYCFNPVTFYFCHDPSGETIEHIVAQITNTPWKERHAYVLPVGDDALRFRFGKAFHVSPFMPMTLQYDWRFSVTDGRLAVHMENHDDTGKLFDATLVLGRREITAASLAAVLARFPIMTLQVLGAIYWHALRLWVRRTPFFVHP